MYTPIHFVKSTCSVLFPVISISAKG